MRLESLYLDGFGHFHQCEIGPVSGPVTVFYGPNEAGKSTLLAFIRTILFGFPVRNRDAHYPPLSGGRHGGRIRLADDAGAVFVLERYAGAHGGPLRVQDAGGETLNPAVILPSLTGNATPDLFRNVFAFSLDELQVATSLNDSSGAIYSAGQGAPELPKLEQAIKDNKRAIFLPSGKVQRVPHLLNTLRNLDTQLRVIEGNAVRYGSLTARKSEIDRELEEAEAELSRLSVRRGEIERLLAGWQDWMALSDCDANLREMPRYEDFPENSIVRLDAFEAQIRQLREDRDEAARQLRRTEEAASVDIAGEDLLYDRERIEAIRRDRNRFDAAVRDLPERQTELREMEDDFSKTVADLGHDWDETELQAFDTSLVVRNQVETWKDRIAEAGDNALKAEVQLNQERRAMQDEKAATLEAREKLPSPPQISPGELSERQDLVRTARSRLGEFERQRQNHETLRAQVNTLAASMESQAGDSKRISPLLIVALVVAGAVLAVAGILIGGGALILGALCGIFLLLAAATLWLMGRPASPATTSLPVASALAGQAADAERAEETARRSLLDSAASLGLREQPDAAALDTAEAQLTLVRNALDAWTSANTRIEDAARREKSQGRRLEGAVTGHEAAVASVQQAQQEWRQWLCERQLNKTLTPEAVTSFLARAETARGTLAETHRMRDRVEAIEFDIQEFRQLVEPLAQRHGLTLDPDDRRQLSIVADELIRRLDEAQTAFSDRVRAMEQAEEERQALDGRQRRLQSAESELAALLTAGGADDAEEFRRRSRQHEERLELERKRTEHRRNLEHLSGPDERFDSFCKALASSDPDKLEEESAKVSELTAELSGSRNALREERGRTDSELEQLSSEDESSALRVRRNTMVEQLREQAREWSRLTVAEALLEKTRHKFEQERQPGVIRHAQEFFSGVTGQRYQRVYAPIGEQTITVTDATGASKQPSELSRGTREQLYLALRFGLIREFGEHAERLPVVVDEALVNFDPGRARLAAEAFAELSETNQVLVFTCHPAIAEMFQDAAGAQVVDISH